MTQHAIAEPRPDPIAPLPMAQNNIHSDPGRSDRIFHEVGERAFAVPPARILSFGCSVGHECLSLKARFPEAEVFGCDINEKALQEARSRCAGQAHIFPSSEELIRAHGPFGLVTAMSVLCRYPKTQGMEDISDAFPFALYDQLLMTIASAVAPGGVLALYNGQYFLEESSVADQFQAIDTPGLNANGFFNRYRRDGTCCTDTAYLTIEGSVISQADGLERLKAARASGKRRHDTGLGSTIIARGSDMPGSLRTVAWRKVGA